MVAILFGLLDFSESSGFFGAQSVPDAKAQWKPKGKDVFPHDKVEEVESSPHSDDGSIADVP